MISRIEIKGFRALQAVATDLTNFQILIGPNASGKSNFFNAFALLRGILNVGLERALLG